MNGFGFIEYDDALDARDVVPGMLFFFSSFVYATSLQTGLLRSSAFFASSLSTSKLHVYDAS